MRYIVIIFSVLLVLFSFYHAQATIIHVPAEQSTIQAGINASVNGDTVLVAPGTYYEHIDFNGKAILLKSEDGAEATVINKIIDGMPIVKFISSESNTSILDGFTVQNANNADQDGGGILCQSSSPIIRNNIIKSNLAHTGGAIFCQPNSSPLISHNILMNNNVSYCGGAIYCEFGGSPIIDYNLIVGNTAPNGSGIFISHSVNAQISNNTLIGNISQQGSIQFWASNASATIINTIISNNSSGYGIYNNSGSVTIIYCDVWNNTSGNFDGCTPGVGCISVDPLFCNTTTGDYHLLPFSPCVGTGQGGTNIGVFGIGCGIVSLSAGPDQQGRALTDVLVKFYVTNYRPNDTFSLYITDSLGWSIVPTHYDVPLDSGETDTVSFMVSIPHITIGTKDKLTLVATSQSDSSISDTASLFVYCNQFAEGVKITNEGNTSGYADSMVSVAFSVQNTGVLPDSYSVNISDTHGWTINPLHFDLALDTAEVDSLNISVNIPYVPLYTTDLLTLRTTSKSNSLVHDSTSLTITCNKFKESWQVGPQENLSGPATTHMSAVFYVSNIGLVSDSCLLTVSDSLTWSIQPPNYKLNLSPGQNDSVTFDVTIPFCPVGTKNKLNLTCLSLTNPYSTAVTSLYVTCNARNIHVPHDFSTIQAAIDFSSHFDSILVAPGTYYEHPNFRGKNVVLKSEKGRDSTVIAAIAGGISMVSFLSEENNDAVIDGFTITGGHLETGSGAGIICYNASPQIRNNKIIHNTCSYGAGIDCDSHSSPLIQDNIIQGNTASTQGGGIRCNDYSSPQLNGNVISGNSSGSTGGGIAGIYNSSLVMINNQVLNNSAQQDGGGLYIGNNSSISLSLCLIAGNITQTGYGGGIGFFVVSSGDITNTTIDGNSAFRGGGIFMDNSSLATIINTIVTNSASGKGIRAEGALPTISYCDVWHNLDENYYGCLPGTGCISADPKYCDPDNDNYFLWSTSPCIGSGQGGANMGAYGICSGTRGDANGDGEIGIGDIVYIINYLYKSGPAPSPMISGDCNCDGVVNVGDIVFLINYLFKGGPAPNC